MTASRSNRWPVLRNMTLFAALCAAIAFYFHALSLALPTPYSTPIELVDAPSFRPAEPPLPAADAADENMLRLTFAGDIMQHREQIDDDFSKSYARLKPLFAKSDLVVGNLEFPVDPTRPVGPPPRSAQFNGSPTHVRALAAAGFDVLVTANNHSFDQGLDGALRTREQIEHEGMHAVATGATRQQAGPLILSVKGIPIAIAAYTFRPNSYSDKDGKIAYWHRNWPIYELNFHDWSAEYRDEGLRVFREHTELARREGARVLIAFVHWGKEWHFQPTEDQRLAARDMIDAGFDLAIGSHAHVLNPAEIYRGKLIAYSLGNVLSAFKPLDVRTSALLDIDLGVPKAGPPTLLDFRYQPILTQRTADGNPKYQVTPVSDDGGDAHADALALARRILGEQAVAPN